MGKLRYAAAATIAAAAVVAAGIPAAGPAGAAAGAPARADARAGPAKAVIAAGTPAQIVPGLPLTPSGPSPAAGGDLGPDLHSLRSYNWAGYVARRSGRTFHMVRATFFVPYLNCAHSRHAYSSDWVGFDGLPGSSKTVEQVGIEANCGGAAGNSPRYRAWYEMYPRAAVVQRTRLAAGDSVTAIAAYHSGYRRFRLSLTDNTSGRGFSAAAGCPVSRSCARKSAEVISEAPSQRTRSGLALLPLADYGAVSFTGIAVTDSSGASGGLLSSLWNTVRIIQEGVVSLRTIARPTTIAGSAFDNYWLATR